MATLAAQQLTCPQDEHSGRWTRRTAISAAVGYTWVDYHNDARAPLLFIAGTEDHLMPDGSAGMAACISTGGSRWVRWR